LIRAVTLRLFPSWFHKYFYQNVNVKPSTSSYIAINKLPLLITGTVLTSICFESLPELNGQISLEVLREDGFKENLVIGRDFMENHGIMVVTKPLSKFEKDNRPWTQLVALANVAEDPPSCNSPSFADVKIDCDNEIKKRLIAVFEEIEKTKIPVINDGYLIKISLKDNSTFAFVPRRFAFAERQEIKTITDDLLTRGISFKSSNRALDFASSKLLI